MLRIFSFFFLCKNYGTESHSSFSRCWTTLFSITFWFLEILFLVHRYIRQFRNIILPKSTFKSLLAMLNLSELISLHSVTWNFLLQDLSFILTFNLSSFCNYCGCNYPSSHEQSSFVECESFLINHCGYFCCCNCCTADVIVIVIPVSAAAVDETFFRFLYSWARGWNLVYFFLNIISK